MTAQERVTAVYPQAYISEVDTAFPDRYVVKGAHHEILGRGETPELAWTAAARKIIGNEYG